MQWWRTRLNTHKLMPSGGQAWIPIRARIPASDHCTLPDPHQFGGKSLQALLDPAHAQTHSRMSEPLSSLRDDTACPAFPQSQHPQACAGTQVLSVALKQAFPPSLQSWDRVQSIEERCVLCGKLLQDEFLQP